MFLLLNFHYSRKNPSAPSEHLPLQERLPEQNIAVLKPPQPLRCFAHLPFTASSGAKRSHKMRRTFSGEASRGGVPQGRRGFRAPCYYIPLSPVAVFIFFSASAWARIISADFWFRSSHGAFFLLVRSGGLLHAAPFLQSLCVFCFKCL